jgi:hypothetical protein
MTDFKLDTTGLIPMPGACGTINFGWGGLNAFTQGYIEAMFADCDDDLRASKRCQECGYDEEPDDEGPESRAAFLALYPVGFSDFAPETLERIIEDCRTFPAWSGRCDHSRHAGMVFHAQRERGQWPDSYPRLTPHLGADCKVRFETQKETT